MACRYKGQTQVVLGLTLLFSYIDSLVPADNLGNNTSLVESRRYGSIGRFMHLGSLAFDISGRFMATSETLPLEDLTRWSLTNCCCSGSAVFLSCKHALFTSMCLAGTFVSGGKRYCIFFVVHSGEGSLYFIPSLGGGVGWMRMSV